MTGIEQTRRSISRGTQLAAAAALVAIVFLALRGFRPFAIAVFLTGGFRTVRIRTGTRVPRGGLGDPIENPLRMAILTGNRIRKTPLRHLERFADGWVQ